MGLGVDACAVVAHFNAGEDRAAPTLRGFGGGSR
jgi:hypothetical protein